MLLILLFVCWILLLPASLAFRLNVRTHWQRGKALEPHSLPSRRTRHLMAKSSLPTTPAVARTGRPRKEKDDVVQMSGKIVETLPNGNFRVELHPGKQVVAGLSGGIRKNRIRLTLGDAVEVELSAYDLTRGRITFRNK